MINQYIHQYGKRLYGLCFTLCASSFDADDLYQETWLKVVKNIRQYDKSKEFEPWLTRICVNTYRNNLRKRVKIPIFNRFLSNEEKDAAFESVPAKKESLKSDYADLYKAIDELPNKLRLTLILFYFKDMDIASTADVLAIPIGTVKSRLNKARKLLKEALTDETDLQF